MSSFEVDSPIICSPFEEPVEHWLLKEGEEPQRIVGRRPPLLFSPRDQKHPWEENEIIRQSKAYAPAYELFMVARIRDAVKRWRDEGYPGVTRTTLDLLKYWSRKGREFRLFFAQMEAAEVVIFLNEARQDFLQGINVPIDDVNENQKREGMKAFLRYACKMATGTGKTTVMGMIAAWSILNKVANKQDARFSDIVLVVCPNVTIRDRLRELEPNMGEASVYRKRDLVPPDLMPDLRRGRFIITNWHTFELQSVQGGSKVVKRGVKLITREKIRIDKKNDTYRGTRLLTEETFNQQVATGLLKVIDESTDNQGRRIIEVESSRHVESDAAWALRVLGRDSGTKGNILVMNDEAHHAYRIRPRQEEEQGSLFDDDPEDEFIEQAATVWIEGLDRVHRQRGINFCVDLSATPYYLSRVGQEANKPFPWVVSDFGLIDAIESGLVKVPQMAVQDNSGDEIPGYFNIWEWILKKIKPGERGSKAGEIKPAAVLKYANTPIRMMAGYWRKDFHAWEQGSEDPRPPVFILVCKNTSIAKTIHEWIADGVCPSGISPFGIPELANENGNIRTIRVDSKVANETDSGHAAQDEHAWMRFVLDTVGVMEWPSDEQKRPIHPSGFLELAEKLGRPTIPPGRDIRCIISVGMLTEGWDCNTVTHIVGLRPFMSQLLCEQVVGRGLRRMSYQLTEDNRFPEEIAKIFGVPFELVPLKSSGGTSKPPEKRRHIFPVPGKEQYQIVCPRVEGYTQAIRNKITVDWEKEGNLILNPQQIPTEVLAKASLPDNEGRPTLDGPGASEKLDLNPFRSDKRIQELIFTLAKDLAASYLSQADCEIPAHVLFPQLVSIVRRFMDEKVKTMFPAEKIDVYFSPYYGIAVERLREAIHPDPSQGETPEIPRYDSRGPCTTKQVNYWTSKRVSQAQKTHLNYVVADTKKWEQATAFYLDNHDAVEAFVKNDGYGFAIPYMKDNEIHDYIPDFVVRLKTDPPCHLVLETKGMSGNDVNQKKTAADRWVRAVNADGEYGKWAYEIAYSPEEAIEKVNETMSRLRLDNDNS